MRWRRPRCNDRVDRSTKRRCLDSLQTCRPARTTCGCWALTNRCALFAGLLQRHVTSGACIFLIHGMLQPVNDSTAIYPSFIHYTGIGLRIFKVFWLQGFPEVILDNLAYWFRMRSRLSSIVLQFILADNKYHIKWTSPRYYITRLQKSNHIQILPFYVKIIFWNHNW